MLVYRRVVLSTHVFLPTKKLPKKHFLGMSGDVWGMLQRYVGGSLTNKKHRSKTRKKTNPLHQVGESLRMQLIKIHAQTTVLHARSEKHGSEW